MTVILRNNTYHVQFPYDPMMVQMLKNNIPASGRKWDNNAKIWQVDTQYESTLRQLFPNDKVPPVATQAKVPIETRVIDLRYVGQVKDRGMGETTAFGYSEGQWSVIFPEKVLRMWFEGFVDNTPGASDSFYSVLGLQKSASQDEIKTGYRRMARQWHPDQCREANAAEIFMRIKEAYDILSNANKKARYDAGLMLKASLGITPPVQNECDNYRAPLRCGLVMADGREGLGRFWVSKILAWEDLTDSFGRVLVASWPLGASKPVELWA